MPNPLIMTGFDEALGRGMGLGLEAAGIRQRGLYQQSEMAHRAALEELARERLQNTAEYRGQMLDLAGQRTGVQAEHQAFLRDREAARQGHLQQQHDAFSTEGGGLYDQRTGGSPFTGMEGPPSPDEQQGIDLYGRNRADYAEQFASMGPGERIGERKAANLESDRRHDELIDAEIGRIDKQRMGLIAAPLPWAAKVAKHAEMVSQIAALEGQRRGPKPLHVAQIAQQQAGQEATQGRFDQTFDQREQFHADNQANANARAASEQDAAAAEAGAHLSTTAEIAKRAGSAYHAAVAAANATPEDANLQALVKQRRQERNIAYGEWNAAAKEHEAAVGAAKRSHIPGQQGAPPSSAAQPAAQTQPAQQPIDTNLIDQIDAAMPNATDAEKAAEYRRRTGGQ